MLRVLHIFHEMSNGGTGHFAMNYYRHIDRDAVQFDFLTSVEDPGYFDEEIRSLGGRLFHAYPVYRDPLRNYRDIARIVRENQYKIVHRHTGSAFGYFDLRAARRGGAEHLIIHAHNTQAGRKIVHRTADLLLRFSCHRLACSQDAGNFLFGPGQPFGVLNNAIEVSRFEYDPHRGQQMRKALGIGNGPVYGHVGRVEEQKNHQKLLSVFSEIRKRQPDSRLVCVGDGSLMDETKAYSAQLGLEDAVIFTGQRSDVSDLLQTFDVFLFPSLYEGLPITLIEAQANGLRCFASQDRVPTAADLTGSVRYIPLTASDAEWADIILNSDLTRNLNASDKVRRAGYDITMEAEKLTIYYQNLVDPEVSLHS